MIPIIGPIIELINKSIGLTETLIDPEKRRLWRIEKANKEIEKLEDKIDEKTKKIRDLERVSGPGAGC